jgi:hypothetical protein
MTDLDLVAKKLAFLETCVADLRRLALEEVSTERLDDLLRFNREIRAKLTTR